MEAKLDLSALASMIAGQGYTIPHEKANLLVSHLANGEVFGVAYVLRHGGEPKGASGTVSSENIKDALELIQWHKAANAKPMAPWAWEHDEIEELEQVWRILNGYDEETMQVPPRQRGSVVIAVRHGMLSQTLRAALTKALEVTGMAGQGEFDTVVGYLTNYFTAVHTLTKIVSIEELSSRAFAWTRGENELHELFELLDCAPGELVETVQKMAGERESVRSVFGVPADASLFEAARKLKVYADATAKAILGRNIHIDDLPGMISFMCKHMGSNDREVILARIAISKAIVEQLGGWDHAYENLRKLDKAAEDLVNRNTNFDQISEDRDAWRRMALKLAE